MTKKPKKNIIKIDGKKFEIVHYDFLPPKTVALSSDVFNKFIKQQEKHVQ